MFSGAHAHETCPRCRSRAYEISRSRYIGAGEMTTGYPVRVWSCGLCNREWEDETLAQINAVQARNAKRACSDTGSPVQVSGRTG